MTREEFGTLKRGSVVAWADIIGLVVRIKYGHVWVLWEGSTVDIYSVDDAEILRTPQRFAS